MFFHHSRRFYFFFLILNFNFNNLFQYFFLEPLLINPGLKILGLLVKSITVDSIPILHFTTINYNFNFLLNSSKTSFALTGLTFVDLFALGIASGKSMFLNKFLIFVFGNLMATVSNFAQAIETNFGAGPFSF